MSKWTEEAYTRFWARMAEIYGRRWYAEHGERISSTWREALSRMTTERAKQAMARCMTAGDKFPCTLSQFMARAKESRTLPMHKPFPRLPRPDSSPKIAAEHLEKIRNSPWYRGRKA